MDLGYNIKYTGKGPLDSKVTPVNYFATIPEGETNKTTLSGSTTTGVKVSIRYNGMEVLVLKDETNNNLPTKYRMVVPDGATNCLDKYWTKITEGIDTETKETIVEEVKSGLTLDCGTY